MSATRAILFSRNRVKTLTSELVKTGLDAEHRLERRLCVLLHSQKLFLLYLAFLDERPDNGVSTTLH